MKTAELPTYRDLYYAWEQSQWETAKLDLASDAEALAGRPPTERGTFRQMLALLRAASERAVTCLVPMCDSAPDEEQQVFLTTQLVDVARHAVFFDATRAVVAGDEGGFEERASAAASEVPEAAQHLLEELGDVALDLVESAEPQLLAEAVALQHLVVQDLLLMPVLEHLGLTSMERGAAAFASGLGHVTRDYGRHISFGRRFLFEAISAADGLGAQVRSLIDAASDEIEAVRTSVGLPAGETAGRADERLRLLRVRAS